MESSDLGRLAERIQEQAKENKSYLWEDSETEAFDGSVPVSEELLAAVKILTWMKYRGVNKWSIIIKYRFDGEQLQRSINVSDAGFGPHLSFTPQETITLAREIAQQRFDEG